MQVKIINYKKDNKTLKKFCIIIAYTGKKNNILHFLFDGRN
jgi:hypothetical protein